MKLFRVGEFVYDYVYTGRHDSEEIARYLRRKTVAQSRALTSTADVDSFLTSTQYIIIGVLACVRSFASH